MCRSAMSRFRVRSNRADSRREKPWRNDGVPIERYAPADKPESIEVDVEAALR